MARRNEPCVGILHANIFIACLSRLAVARNYTRTATREATAVYSGEPVGTRTEPLCWHMRFDVVPLASASTECCLTIYQG